jgi:hypothetical protein
MSTSTPSTTTERERAIQIGEIDSAFRIQIKAHMAALSKQAGVDALDFLLHPEKSTAEQSARAAKARSDAVGEAFERYISACRNYHDVNGAINTVIGVAESMENLGNYQRSEAESHALKELTGTASETADGRMRKMALNSLNRAEGTLEFVKLLRQAFAPVLKDIPAVTRAES